MALPTPSFRTRLRTRRALALSATGVLAAGLAWLPAGPASATVAALFGAGGHAQTGSSCTLTSGDANPTDNTPLFSAGTKSRSVNLDATFTNTADPTDVVHASGHYSGSTTVEKKRGNLSSVVLSGRGSVSIDSAQGSSTACDPSAYVAVATQLQFDETSPGWLYVQRSTVDKPGLAETIFAKNTLTGAPVIFELYQGGRSNASTRGFLEPGTYAGGIAVGLTAGNQIVLEKTQPRSSASVVFHRAGSALRGTRGPGRAYVSFPSSVSCATHRATLRWRSSAGKVASGSFYVNGKKKASVSRPRSGRKIVLRHLRSSADIVLSTKLHLDNGSSASAKRRYVPCRG